MALAVTREQGAQPESQVQASAISRVESKIDRLVGGRVVTAVHLAGSKSGSRR